METLPGNIIPFVTETSARGERTLDIYSLLLRERIIFLGTPISDQIANLIIAQLLYLEREDPEKDINLYVHCPGGIISAGLAIYDTIQFVKPDVATICVGLAASMGALLLAAGAKGKRAALPNSRILIHQPWGGVQGQVTDIEIHTKEMVTNRTMLNKILAEHTGKPLEKIQKDTERNYFMSVQEAKEYGLIDEIFQKKKK